SGDGRFVAFESEGTFVTGAGSKLNVYVKDLLTGSVDCTSFGAGGAAANGPCSQARISANGQLVLFRSKATNIITPDANTIAGAIFLRDSPAGATTRVNLNAADQQADGECFVGDLSADGTHAVFLTDFPPSNMWTGFI